MDLSWVYTPIHRNIHKFLGEGGDVQMLAKARKELAAQLHDSTVLRKTG